MWVSYILAFVISFMFFIYEPIIMYSNNINDFWFDLQSIFYITFLLFIITFIILSIVNNILFFVNKNVLKVFNVLTFIGFICMYIQGNFLAGNLPALDGTPIEWFNYKLDMFISIILLIFIIGISIVLIMKININTYMKYCGLVTLAVFVMLSVSLISTLITTDSLKLKSREFISTSTDMNINKYSKNENLIIFCLDSIDSKYFAEAMKNNSSLSSSLKDFTYYPDTMSVHPFTEYSVPLILTGYTFERQSNYIDFTVEAYKKSILFNNLYDNDFEVNVYENELFFYDKDALKLANIINSSQDGNLLVDKIKYIKAELKYDLFRYLPFFLKKYSRIETLDFKNTKVNIEDKKEFISGTIEFLDYLNLDVEISEQNNFKFFHISGAHVPFDFDKNLELKENANYMDEVEGSLNLINKYINYLKINKVYDNSNIIIMSDHGYTYSATGERHIEGRQNPILFIKGKNETNKKMKTSDKPISYIDLSDLYLDLLNNKKNNELFSKIKSDRTRRYLLYDWMDDKPIIEYETKGKAWETKKMYKTGKTYNF